MRQPYSTICDAGHWNYQNHMAISQEDIDTASLHRSASGWRLVRWLSHILPLHMVMPVKQHFANVCVCNAVGGFIRVFITDGSFVNSCAISLSLFMIVMASVLTGTMLPFGLAKAGIDPANAGTSVQVQLLQVWQNFRLSVSLANPVVIGLQYAELHWLCMISGSHGHLRCGDHLLHMQSNAQPSESDFVAKLTRLWHRRPMMRATVTL